MGISPTLRTWEWSGSSERALVRRAATLVVQEALEAEQRDFIGRDRYERSRCRTSGRRRWPTGPSCSLLL